MGQALKLAITPPNACWASRDYGMIKVTQWFPLFQERTVDTLLFLVRLDLRPQRYISAVAGWLALFPYFQLAIKHCLMCMWQGVFFSGACFERRITESIQ